MVRIPNHMEVIKPRRQPSQKVLELLETSSQLHKGQKRAGRLPFVFAVAKANTKRTNDVQLQIPNVENVERKDIGQTYVNLRRRSQSIKSCKFLTYPWDNQATTMRVMNQST